MHVEEALVVENDVPHRDCPYAQAALWQPKEDARECRRCGKFFGKLRWKRRSVSSGGSAVGPRHTVDGSRFLMQC